MSFSCLLIMILYHDIYVIIILQHLNQCAVVCDVAYESDEGHLETLFSYLGVRKRLIYITSVFPSFCTGFSRNN